MTAGAPASEPARQRLDVWLWRARFFKTRTLAAKFVAGSSVRLTRDGDTQRVEKSATGVKPGDSLTFQIGPRLRIIDILALGARRGPAAEAQALYLDRSPPPPDRPERAGPRPTKRDRRALDAFSAPDFSGD